MDVMMFNRYDDSYMYDIIMWNIIKHNYIITSVLDVKKMQKYQIISVIGQGAYGVVLKCRDVEFKTVVAVKKFKDTDQQDQTRKTTMRQIKILKMMNHPNIVSLKEAFRKKSIVYLVFEYVENNLLEVLQKSPNGLQLPTIRKLIYQLLKGLTYLHSQSIIHRDIKPENLLVSNSFLLKICDFGFARLNKLDRNEEGMTDYVATRWYRPPQLLIGGQYSTQIDTWAVGCIMCELIDGNPLFPGENQLDQLFLIQKTLGPLTPRQNEIFKNNKRFSGMKFPELQNLETLEKKYFGKVDQKALNFIKSLLKVDPAQRLTSTDALSHNFFDPERVRHTEQTAEASFRKDVHTSTTNRKRQHQQMLERVTRNGKIYTKSKQNHQAIAMIYQSTNNCKIDYGQTKSLTKPTRKIIIPRQQISLEKHQQKEILRKTEANKFYIDPNIKTPDIKEISAKDNQLTWQSTTQLPFLVTNQQTNNNKTKKVNKQPFQILQGR